MIRAELAKQLRRPRTYLTLGALVLLCAALTLALGVTGPNAPEHVGDVPLLIVPGQSGFSVALIALASTMKFFIPLAVAIFAGETVAGEANWGSLRYLLARGVGRTRLLGTKALVAALLSVVAVLLVPLVGLGVGLLAFGWHPLAIGTASGGLGPSVTWTPLSMLGWLVVSDGYVLVGMLSIFAFALFLSTVTARPIAAVAGGVGLTIVSRVLNADYLPGVAVLNPYMPNNDVDLWQHFFTRPTDTAGMGHFLVLQLVYGAVFLGLATWWFRRKDVLS